MNKPIIVGSLLALLGFGTALYLNVHSGEAKNPPCPEEEELNCDELPECCYDPPAVE
ncbi:hypothetical protein [Vacuolonema iberomarrocanum]|uniref:hypothetical protein n=1 Tax=Vacuolonema iberomarrocanum TaxID=3454632 RepID=UPI001A0AA315|nr:hypothetical protein [filamentous cyanobacterium LEGE 07170]